MHDDVVQQHLDAGRRALAARVALARQRSGEFTRLVLRDEKSGKPIVQQPFQDEWHALAERHRRLLIFAFIESAKTQQMSVGRPLWLLGNDPARRGAIVSNTYGQAEKVVRTIGQYIERSPIVRQVFPGLKKAQPWGAGVITVERPTISKDPSLQALGVHGAVLGSRLEFVILDDILDFENTRTAKLRQELWDWFQASILGRLTEGATIVAVGTAFHPDDLLHRLEATGQYHVVRFPVLDPQGCSRWPGKWPIERINAAREEMGILEFSRQLLCRARDDSERRVHPEWFAPCLARGNGLAFLDRLDAIPDRAGVFSGVDLGVASNDDSDRTAIFTILVHPDATRQPIMIESGKWTGPDIVRRILDTHARYGSILYVENNAAQDFILQFAREHSAAVPIRPFTTGRNKAHPEFGVESIAVELQAAKWAIPNSNGNLHPETRAWMDELLLYDPKEHTGDRLMASWFAREGARRYSARSKGSVGLRVIGSSIK